MSDASTIAHLVRLLLVEQGQATLTVESSSMEPLLAVETRIRIEAAPLDQLCWGDIVTVAAPDALYTHRYVQTLTHNGQRFLVTRGDQPLAYDPAWRASQLLGRVIACEQPSGWLSLQHGAGRWLNRHLAAIARFENWLYSSGVPTFDSLAAFETRLLGRWWRQDRIRLWLLRIMRGCWLRWSRVAVAMVVFVTKSSH